MKDLKLKKDKDFNKILFEENGFSIRVGYFKHCFILHDSCTTKSGPRSIAYDVSLRGNILVRKQCKSCKMEYSDEMDGLITLLNWKI